MLNRLVILGMSCLIAGSMSGQPNQAANHKGNDAKQGQPAVISPNGKDEQPNCQADQAKPSGNPPSGNASIERPHWWAIPDWWLVIVAGITGAFICWQSWEIRKSAEASRDQVEISRKAFVSQFRPRVPVRVVRLTEQDGALNVEIWLTNTGDSPAHITRSDITVGWEVPAELKKKVVASSTFPPASLQPGQDHSATVDITEIAVPYRVAQIAVDEMGRDQEAWIYCFGNLTYLDDNGSSRSTGFFRKYNIKRKRFVPSDDPEEEYAD